MKEYRIGGYNLLKKSIIDLGVWLLREVIPVLGAVIIMSVVMVVVVILFLRLKYNVPTILLLFLAGMLAILILGFIYYLISKLISAQAEKLYGRQELYWMNDQLYYTVDIQYRFFREIKAFKIVEINRIKKTTVYWELTCLCVEIRMFCDAKNSVEEVLENLRKEEKHLKIKKETLVVKRQYGRQSDQRIDSLFQKITV